MSYSDILEPSTDALERLVADRAAALEEIHAAHEELRRHQEFLRSVLDTDPNFVFVKDPEGRFVLVNKALADAYGCTVEEMIGKSDADFNLDEEQVAAYLEADRQMISSGEQVFITEERFAAAKSRAQWVQTVKRPIRVPGSDAIHVLGIATDITDRKEAMAALRRSESRLEEAQRISRVGSWEYELATGKITWSKETFRQFGRDPELGEPDYDTILERYCPDDAARIDESLKRAIAEHVGYELDIHAVTAGDEEPRWYRAIGRPVLNADGNVVRLVGTQIDITERRRAVLELQAANERLTEGTALLQQHIQRINEQTVQLELQKNALESMNARLATLASTDGLTGLKNHRTFHERLIEEVDRANRYVTPVSVLMLDVDEFKAFNDCYGHPAGDMVLQKVAEVLRSTARKTDLVARYGGEEFALILPETDGESAQTLAESLRRAVEGADWSVMPVTASFGIATSLSSPADAASLIAQADAALYRSKRDGRNRVTHWTEESAALSSTGDKLKKYAQMVRQALDLHEDTLAGASSGIAEQLRQAYNATVECWSNVIRMRDGDLADHSDRVTEMMVRLARRAGMNDEEVLYAKWGSLLHDIGKLGIPDHILHKSDELTGPEWAIVRRHPAVAHEMLSSVQFLKAALDIPIAHHERWDGTGYPLGLQGDEIPLIARLFMVIDAYDSLRSARPYRGAWPEEKVLEYLADQSGRHFDPRAVELFLAMLAEEQGRIQRAA